MNEDHIAVAAGSTSYVGEDAVNLFRARVLASSLRLYAKTGILPTRGVKVKDMFHLATQYTGKPYVRGDATKAAADVMVWAEAMQAALPIVRED